MQRIVLRGIGRNIQQNEVEILLCNFQLSISSSFVKEKKS